MSRSKRKPYYKVSGPIKNEYWRVHRRVNKKILSHFFKSHYDVQSQEDYFEDSYDDLKNLIIKYGEYLGGLIFYNKYPECYDIYMDNLRIEDINDLELMNPKEIVNDYDYNDLDYYLGKFESNENFDLEKWKRK